MKIDSFKINQNSPVFIIAEMSANHNGNINTAIETIKAAKRAGANCIKLQTYTPDTITIDSNKDDFLIKGTIWDGSNLYDLYEKAHTPWEWHKELFRVAKEEGLICFSSPFDNTAVDFLENLNSPAYNSVAPAICDDISFGQRDNLCLNTKPPPEPRGITLLLVSMKQGGVH